ncbi:sugar-binding transcriptional regulator [Labrys wisconsinensis]|uniref:DNA-binding transcriptional regulator LsrR (DeoR family) n=1 Tax=Labrys wisconsinensis TaxID=425677 RepID=A0ABU0JF04_9HYPH|nr:sugar-binding transcriptional regulator [Labrys wisconsinensis]MDQ0471707.1 DNA-binding transcriptional regulator LsrR (DeoR family) [Labrys wisconsinensis]
MAQALGAAVIDEEASLATRAAWLYFAGGFTQAEVAARLNVPSVKAHRLISRASRDGLIRVFVDGPVAECFHLEEAIKQRWGIEFCHVSPDIGESGLPLKTLGLAGAAFLRSQLESGGEMVIGIGHGRTLAAAVAHLPQVPGTKARFVSLLGGLTRKFSASPFDVIHRLAERTGAEAYVMPMPVFANTAADRAVLVSQIGIADVFALARSATLMFAGIGEARAEGSLVASGMLRADEVADLERAGVEGEILSHFLGADGRVIETPLSQRSISVGVEDLHGRRVVAIAGGPSKTSAIRAVLNSDFLKGLITDEATARRLVGPIPGA